MINFDQIQAVYPEHLRIPRLKRFMLREYLQYKILEIIFDSEFANKLSFLGGTALRIIHDNSRFSEDLDFDNFNLTFEEFDKISQIVKKGLELEGCKVEIRNVAKGAFRCYLKLPDILYQNQLSSHEGEKLLIQLDTFGHNFNYSPDKNKLNKFDVLTDINVTPKDILLAQKIFAAYDRKMPKGRDFYDIVFLMMLGIRPNYDYLKEKIQIENADTLKKFMIKKSEKLNFSQLADDVEPFLFYEKDKKKVEQFLDFIRIAKFD